MKRVFLLISELCALMISLQSHAQNLNQQALLEAYRNGTLSQGKIEELKKSQAGNSQDVNRTRRMTALYQDSTKQNIPIGLTMESSMLLPLQKRLPKIRKFRMPTRQFVRQM